MELWWDVVPHIKTFSRTKLRKKYEKCKEDVKIYTKKGEKNRKFSKTRENGRENKGKNEKYRRL